MLLRGMRIRIERHLLHDLLPRLGAVLCFGYFLIRRLATFQTYPVRGLWFLEVAYLALLVSAYVLRTPVLHRAAGFRERYLPFLVAMLPLAIVDERIRAPEAGAAAGVLLALGTAIECAALWSLRRHFSIMVEARGVVTNGPYRHARHPIYVGRAVAVLGSVLLRWDAATTALYVAYVAGQVRRAQLEEAKLAAHLPAYAAYRSRVPMFGWRWR